jgi:group I intron endonuclease
LDPRKCDSVFFFFLFNVDIFNIDIKLKKKKEAPAFIFNGTEFIVAKGKSAPKALRDLRGKPGIYAWFCITTGNIYVGSALNLFQRGYKDHYLNVESNKNLQEAIRLWGLGNFLFIILKICVLTEQDKTNDYYLTDIEQEYLDAFPKAVKFNIAEQARSSKGNLHSEKTKAQISAKLLGRKLSEEIKAKIAASKRMPSEETKAKLSASKTGFKHSDETKAKIAASRRGTIQTAAHIANRLASIKANKDKEG